MPDVIEVEGKVVEVLPNTLFRVEVDKSLEIPELLGKILLCHISGKMRMHYVRLMVGDRVRIEMSPKYELEKGRIVRRI